MARPRKTGPVYQLKITLAGIRPPIWRRVQVRDCSLTKLHEVIQIAMGWHFSHLWGFDIEGEQFRTARRVLTNISEVPSEVLGMAEQLSTLDVRPQ